jgi:hypothetical protein
MSHFIANAYSFEKADALPRLDKGALSSYVATSWEQIF